MDIEERLKKLIGEQLSSVVFVQDYLQVYFDGPRFTLYVWPEVWISKERYYKENPQYRNMLCELISKKIIDVIFKDKLYLILYFENKSNYIYLNLNPSNNGVVYETAIFEDEDDNMVMIFD